MNTRSKSSHAFTKRIVNPRDAVEEVYSFPAGNAWSRDELRCLNVTFVHRDDRRIRSLTKARKWDSMGLATDDLKQRIVLVGLTEAP